MTLEEAGAEQQQKNLKKNKLILLVVGQIRLAILSLKQVQKTIKRNIQRIKKGS